MKLPFCRPTDQAANRPLMGAGARHLRVVYLDHLADLSGGELALARLLPALTEVDAHVILAQDGPLAGRLQAAGVSVEVLPLAESARALRRANVRLGHLPVSSLVATAGYVARLTARLRALQPDLVHTNSLKAGVYGTAAARLAGVPVVWQLRDCIPPDYLPKSGVRLVRAMASRLPQALLGNSVTTLATIPMAPSRGQVRAVVASPLPALPYRARPPDTGPHRFTVGMVGRLMPWKGQHIFIEAFARAFPDGTERAILVGGPLFGEEGYERSLREQAQATGVGDRIEVRGHSNDVPAELALGKAASSRACCVHPDVVAGKMMAVYREALDMTAGVRRDGDAPVQGTGPPTNLAHSYDEWHSGLQADDFGESPWHGLVLRHIGSLDQCRVLEVGCGRGGLARRLVTGRPGLLVCADFSKAAVRTAANGSDLLAAGFEVADIQHLSHPDSSFDVVVSCEPSNTSSTRKPPSASWRGSSGLEAVCSSPRRTTSARWSYIAPTSGWSRDPSPSRGNR